MDFTKQFCFESTAILRGLSNSPCHFYRSIYRVVKSIGMNLSLGVTDNLMETERARQSAILISFANCFSAWRMLECSEWGACLCSYARHRQIHWTHASFVFNCRRTIYIHLYSPQMVETYTRYNINVKRSENQSFNYLSTEDPSRSLSSSYW